MPRFLTLLLFVASVFTSGASAQKSTLEPLHVPAGTILTFHLQTRLHPTGDFLDSLPKGTVLQVRILDPIDSATDQDGTEFRGTIVSPVLSGDEIVVHPDAEVHGLMALLRSKSHPDGFRYELLLTSLTEQGGKPIALTASLKSSFADAPTPSSAIPSESKAPPQSTVPATVSTHR